jgi:cytochrome b561
MTQNQYTKTAIVLHWLIGIGILAMFGLGWFMADIPKDQPKAMSFDLFDLGIYTWNMATEVTPRTFYFNLHKSVGITLLALIVVRLFWRITHRPPALLDTLTATEKKIATGGHHLLYLLMFALPITGLVMAINSKFEYGVKWFGISLMNGLDNKAIRESFVDVHEVVGIIMLVVIGIHVLGALKHKFIDKDGTMSRMSLCGSCCKGSSKK